VRLWQTEEVRSPNGPSLLSLVVAGVLLAAPLQAVAFTVALDPGHGGEKEGASSPAGVKEKEVALAVAKRLAALLEKTPDVKVVFTRESDVNVELPDRTKAANAAKADVLLSIHCNSMPTREARRATAGIETYFLSADATDADAQALAEAENADVAGSAEATPADPISDILHDLSRTEAHADSKPLAVAIQSALVKGLRARDRGVRQAPFIVLLGAEMPAVLAEIGFISHPAEGRHLADAEYQEKVAVSLRDALLSYRENVFARRMTH
jgi:N-acetylmuramoyl-L-alanine amidase